jgi:F-type H+-transporting ATPase subunit b
MSYAAEKVNPIIPHIPELIVGAIAFAFVVYVLGKFVWPRMEATFQARVDAIEGGIKRAEEAQAEANRVLEEYRRQLAEARTEAARIRDEARADAVAIREDVLAKAAEERDRIIATGEERLAAQRATIVRELRTEVGSLAVELAGRIVGDSLVDEARQRGTVERFLSEIGEGGSEPAGAASAASGRSGAESAVKRPRPDSSGRR